MKTDNSLYMATLRSSLTTSIDTSQYAEDILDFIESGVNPVDAAKLLDSYTSRKSEIRVAIPIARKTHGAPTSPHEAAAKLIRDYGKARGLQQALKETWNNPKGSEPFMFWAQVSYLLND